ncbi:MAG: four-carbon acid sugar kinase family protein, partial [Acetanaerobacterium sp.]
MITILVIADDFTGALDSGVQLAKAGIKTLVTTDCNVDLSVDNEYQALVVDNETRHIPPEDAGDRVFKLAKQAQAKGIPYIYKKTDSTLRGNVGSELHALLRAAESGRVYFAPAFPKTGRTTENGIQYLRGIPLEQTAFAHDPIDPVKTGVISDIIACQAPGIPVRVVNVGDYAAVTPPDKPDIVVLDAKCDNDLKNIAHFLHGIDGLGVASGCAGLLEYYPQ